MEEIWKDIYFIENNIIYDYRGLYQVSNFGRIKSLKRGNPKILKPRLREWGYLGVALRKDNKTKEFKIHRLVAFMFIENNDTVNKRFVNHKDENKKNNNLNNLEWCTYEYNNNFGTINKRRSESLKGENNHFFGKTHNEESKRKISKNNPNKRAVIQFSREYELIHIWQSIEEASKNTDILPCNIGNCCRKRQKTAGGFIWRYVEEENNELL